MHRRAISLIAVTAVILFVAIAILGIVSFVFQGARLTAQKLQAEIAVYLAQAGVCAAMEDRDDNGKIDTAAGYQELGSGSALYYGQGKASGYLAVDAAWCWFIDYTDLENIPLTNVSVNYDVIITGMTVEWSANGSASLKKILVNSKQVWTGKLGKDTGVAQITFAPGKEVVIPKDTSFSKEDDNVWQFDNEVTAGPVCITFNFSDASSRRVCVIDRDFRTGNNEFLITSTGRVGPGAGAWKRSIEATYDTGARKITSWQETNVHTSG